MRTVFLFLLCLFGHQLFAQAPLQTIRGTVIDKITRQPVVGATITIQDSDPLIGTATDSEGAFRFEEVSVGRLELKCTYVGYETYISEGLLLTSAKELVVEIEMTEGVMLEGVQVVASNYVNAPINELAVVSTRSFSAEETGRIAASINDMGRMALAFPGVQQGRDDTENDIIIRGNSSFGMLWRLEGIDIPNPNHFARPGTSGGGITVFSAQLLSRSDFSTGGMPAEYGNALSGAFDVHFKKGNFTERAHRARVSLIGLDFATEGPIQKGRSSYVVNYRYSTLGLLNKMGFHLIGERVSNDFQDLSFNLAFQGENPKNTFTVFGMGGLSTEHYTPVEDPLERDAGIANHWEDRVQGSNMAVVGSTFTHLIDDRSYIKAVVAGMGSDIFRMYDTLSHQDVAYRYNTQRYLDWRISSAVSYNRKWNARWRTKAGLIFHQIFFDFFKETAPRSLTDDITTFQSEISVRGGGTTQTGQAYAQGSWKLSESLTLNGGVHWLHLFLNNTDAIDPRISLKWQLSPQHSLSFASGQHSQILPLAAYFFQDSLGNLPNKNLDMIHSWHWIAGHTWVTAGKLKITTEVYFQQLREVPVQPNTKSIYWMLNNQQEFPEFEVVNKGSGINYGIDLAVEKFFSNKIYFLLTASVFESFFEPLSGERFNTRFGTGWVSSYTFGKEFQFRKGAALQLGARVLFNGGFRYSPHDPQLSAQEGQFVELVGAQWSEQVDPYFRIDTRIAYRFNKKRYAGNISLDIQNVTSQKNINSIGYDPLVNDTYFRRHPGGDFIPVLSFQFDF